ncbi:MAG: hypothetical protein ABL924_07325 [Methyloglobulus sp.]
MTRRDVVKLCIFTPQTALRENTQHYRFWGLKIFTPLTPRFQDFQRRFLRASSHRRKKKTKRVCGSIVV